MQIIQDIGLVLKKTLYQDTKLIVNVFTKQAGLIAFSVTVSKTTAHRLGCFEPGHLLRFDFKKISDHYRLHDCSVIFSPQGLKESFEAICLWAQFLNTLHQILPSEHPLPLFFDCLKNSLPSLDTHPRKKTLLDFLLLKWLQLEGFLQIPSHLQTEIQHLLQMKKFSDITEISSDLSESIQQQIQYQLN